jgi:opacity protein-like surface antigen
MACLSLGVPVTAAAGDVDDTRREDVSTLQLTSKWRIFAGGNFTDFNTTAGWSAQGLAGAVILVEDTLGLDAQTTTFILGASYRFNRRHSLGLSATDLRRTASRALEGEIEWGDYVFRGSATVRTELDTRIFKLTYRYDFSDMDRLNAGFAVGLSTFDIGLTLSGEARLESDDGEEWIEGVVEGADGIAPVPVFGFFLEYALSPRWITRFQADLIELSLGDYGGRVVEADFAIEFAVSDAFALGLTLGGTDLEYRAEEDDEKFGIRYRFSYVGAHAGFTF